MVITLKVDCKLVILMAASISLGVAALLFAFPAVSIWIPSNSSEMASWVQAFGIFISMGIVIWASYAPVRNEKKNIVNSLRLFYVELLDSIFEIKIGLKENKYPRIVLAAVCVEEQLVAGRSSRLELLPVETMKKFKVMQQYAAQIVFISKKFESNNNSEAQKEFTDVINLITKKMKEMSPIIFSEMNGVESEKFDFDSYLKNYEYMSDELIKEIHQVGGVK